MRRGRRDFENARPTSNRSFKRRHINEQGLSKSVSQGIASRSSIDLSPSQIENAVSLSELRKERSLSSDWPWDKAPKGCESLSVPALKLFGIVTPSAGELSIHQLPDEVLKMKRAVPLKPENSWIFRKINDMITEDILTASRSATEGRPVNLPSFDPLLVNKETMLVKNRTDLNSIQEAYGPVAEHSFLGDNCWAVRLQSPKEPLPDDAYILPRQPTQPVVEVLNALPLGKGFNQESVESDMEYLCKEVGESFERIWRRDPSPGCPYNLARIFIATASTASAESLAEKLGQRSLRGKRLITSLNYSSDLQ